MSSHGEGNLYFQKSYKFAYCEPIKDSIETASVMQCNRMIRYCPKYQSVCAVIKRNEGTSIKTKQNTHFNKLPLTLFSNSVELWPIPKNGFKVKFHLFNSGFVRESSMTLISGS